MDTQSKLSSPVIHQEELISEILSRLSVKTLIQMKCVCKSWKSLISQREFIKIHLNRSSQISQFSLITRETSSWDCDYSFVTFPINSLLQNRRITLPKDPFYRLKDKDCRHVVGFCNGLVCLIGYSLAENNNSTWLRFWNPATRKISDKLGSLHAVNYQWDSCNFVFGYDNSTNTYKVVALDTNGEGEVKFFSLGDNVWRSIQNFPVKPNVLFSSDSRMYGGIHFSCTVNWLASIWNRDDNLDQYVIISLDLGAETYKQFLTPSISEDVPLVEPSICLLRNSLCFFLDSMGTDFIIWKMTQFGDDKSWTRLLKFSYENLGLSYKYEFGLLRLKIKPIHLSEDGDALVFANNLQERAILYNWRTKRAKKARINKNICWFSMMDYVESLV